MCIFIPAIVATAVQEDVDAIGLSILSGAHNTVFPRIIELLKEKDASDIVCPVINQSHKPC